MLNRKLTEAALQAGAAKAVVIPQAQIVLNAEFRSVCESNQCGAYGRCWVCPPHIGEIHELMAKVRAFPKALWYQSVGTIEDSFDFEGMMAAGRDHALLGQRIQAAAEELITGEFLHLSCGGCHLCETCAKRTGDPCRHPALALPAMEGYGIDVYNTTRSSALKYINGTNTVTYFGLILFSE